MRICAAYVKSVYYRSEQIFLAYGATDFRKQADLLAAMVSMQFHLDPFADQCIFLFCNRKRNGIKLLRHDAKCTKCGTQEGEHDTCHFQKAAVPAPPLAHSISTPSLLAQVLYQKFVMGMPFARQENDWYRLGLVLPRASMANWSIRCCEEWLMPIYNRIYEQLLTCQVLHMDETRIQCNKEAGKKAGSDSFMWVMRSVKRSPPLISTIPAAAAVRRQGVCYPVLAGI